MSQWPRYEALYLLDNLIVHAKVFGTPEWEKAKTELNEAVNLWYQKYREEFDIIFREFKDENS